MCDMPFSMIGRGGWFVTSFPINVTCPLMDWRNPVSDSTSSVCPLPWTPATPKISPARTENETPRTASKPRWSSTCKSFTINISSVGFAGSFSTFRITSRPTIMAAKWGSSVSFGVTVPTTCPARITVIRSAIANTSFNLWVMKIMDTPWEVNSRIIRNRSSTSCGVSTAVGSSKIKISAFR